MLALFNGRLHSRLSAKFLGMIIAAFITITLIGCAKMETHLTLYANETWQSQLLIEIPPETIAMIGGPAALEARLKDQLQQAGLKETDVNFHQETRNDGITIIEAQVKGQTFDQLNRMIFDGQATIEANTVDGQRQITIKRTYVEPPLGLTIIKISGGAIIHNNADRVEGNTAIWENPHQVEITLTEAGEQTWWLWGVGALIGGGVCLSMVVVSAVAGTWWYWRRGERL
ncbi:MAG: hypothetical protein HC875_27335 [Anaerolineales bacterium]|nr:hypothetical protein [Anaerolineales bacterium]